MKHNGSSRLFQGLFLLFAVVTVASWCQAAESTADVSANAALKAKARHEVIGAAAKLLIDPEYKIGYRDILYVSIYGEGSMAVGEGVQPPAAANRIGRNGIRGRDRVREGGGGIEVRQDGRISLLHIGDVSVVGMTLRQLSDYLKKLYSTIYENPSVTVTLVQSNSRQYTIMGQVRNPGLYHLDFPVTIVMAIAKAGGFTEWAKFDVTVIRQTPPSGLAGKQKKGAEGKTFEFDYNDFLKGHGLGNNITIKSGDVIVVH